jgi:SAM-dependent methyltransferase
MQLPIPFVGRAMVSDGRILKESLKKTSCLFCGLVSHVQQPSGEITEAVYGTNYALATASPDSDKARGSNYANVLTKLVTPAKRILEVGCGSGALLKELQTHWPEASLHGIDPSVPSNLTHHERIQFERGFFDTYLADAKSYDLIISINVIEHVADPKAFFSRAASLLSEAGQLAIFCPASNPPNLELVLHDHLHTFTSNALVLLAASAGFTLSKKIEHLDPLGDFQFILFNRSRTHVSCDHFFLKRDETSLAIQRIEYLQAWNHLEEELWARTAFASRLVLFGAGQMAALLRTYAPHIWERVDLLVVDNADEAWVFEKQVKSYAEMQPILSNIAILIATAPSSQAYLASRLESDGLNPVRFDDVISR